MDVLDEVFAIESREQRPGGSVSSSRWALDDVETDFLNLSRRERVTSPPTTSAINDQSVDVVPVIVRDSITPRFVNWFPYRHLNRVQSAVFGEVTQTNNNIVIASPTGSGKTHILELAIMRLVQMRELSSNTSSGMARSIGKVVYISPIKSLCQEMAASWKIKFGPLHLKVLEFTGDTDTEIIPSDLGSVDIILTTPEKWDSVTRKWKDNIKLVKLIELILIDEVHLIGEPRGATLEACISRMKTIASYPDAKKHQWPCSLLRIIALSATMPNVNCVACWLQAKGYFFDQSYRPVPLHTQVIGFKDSTNDFLFERNLNYRVLDIIRNNSDGRPTLIFCSTRGGAQKLAQHLVNEHFSMIRDVDHRKRLQVSASHIENATLKLTVAQGVGFHSAALCPTDRSIVENLYRASDLSVLCTTSTLAMGVNLPAYLVIIKGTQQWKGPKLSYQEMDSAMLLQMIGRAGRPQYDIEGVAVILTKESTRDLYEQLTSFSKPLESHLALYLPETINSEIALCTIKDLSQAISWLKSTFYYVRVLKNPTHYGFPAGVSVDDLNQRLMQMCLKTCNVLVETGLVWMDTDGFAVASTELGKTAARNSLRISTAALLKTIGHDVSMRDFLATLSKTQEFSETVVKRNEKKLLKELSNTKIRFTTAKTFIVKEPFEKVNILLQAVLGEIRIEDWSLRTEAISTALIASRLARVFGYYFLTQSSMSPAASVAFILSKSLQAQMWYDSPHMLKQLNGLGDIGVKKLEDAGIKTFEHLVNKTESTLDSIIQRRGTGSAIKSQLRELQLFDLAIQPSSSPLRVTVDITATDLYSPAATALTQDKNAPSFLFLAFTDDERGIFFKSCITRPTSFVTILPPNAPRVRFHLIHTKVCGIDHLVTYEVPGYKAPAPKQEKKPTLVSSKGSTASSSKPANKVSSTSSKETGNGKKKVQGAIAAVTSTLDATTKSGNKNLEFKNSTTNSEDVKATSKLVHPTKSSRGSNTKSLQLSLDNAKDRLASNIDILNTPRSTLTSVSNYTNPQQSQKLQSSSIDDFPSSSIKRNLSTFNIDNGEDGDIKRPKLSFDDTFDFDSYKYRQRDPVSRKDSPAVPLNPVLPWKQSIGVSIFPPTLQSFQASASKNSNLPDLRNPPNTYRSDAIGELPQLPIKPYSSSANQQSAITSYSNSYRSTVPSLSAHSDSYNGSAPVTSHLSSAATHSATKLPLSFESLFF